jgi:nucleoside-diphosphate-sugar epimerase
MKTNHDGQLPRFIDSESILEDILSRPSRESIDILSKIRGDILILGVGGKIGPSLAKLVRNAIEESGVKKKVFAVSRFSRAEVKDELANLGIVTIKCDLLEENSIDTIPEIPNVIYMVGMKFGTEENEPLTWATNAYIPGVVAQKFKHSRIVIFSTGNVYPLVPITSGGALESHPPEPIGEYAQSCLGRERVFEYFCRKFGTKALFMRLNYAIDLRYGVILDVALKVFHGIPIDLRMGYVNVIWQGDVNNAAILGLAHCTNPPKVLNVTGPETISVRWLAKRFGVLFGREPTFENSESETALLSNASEYHRLSRSPKVSLETMISWIAHWVQIGGPTLNKPTHFDIRDGRF